MSAFAAIAYKAANVADVMHRGVASCSRAATLTRVAALMTSRRVHCVVVIDDATDAAALWGIVSDLDLVAAASVRTLEEQTAGATASTPAVTIAPHESLEEAARKMTKHGVTHLVVVDAGSSSPIGVVSTLDLADALAEPRSP